MMNLSKQICKDGKTLLIGGVLLNSDVLNGVKEVINMTYTDEMDIICIQNCIEDWEEISIQDQEIIYCIIANVYSDVIFGEIDTFIDDCYEDGVHISYCKGTQTFIPTSINTNTLENTFVKV